MRRLLARLCRGVTDRLDRALQRAENRWVWKD